MFSLIKTWEHVYLDKNVYSISLVHIHTCCLLVGLVTCKKNKIKNIAFSLSSSYNVIERDVSKSAREIDASCKNKWMWDWLTEKDVNGDFLSDYIKKVDQPGVAICSWCKEILKYGSSGKKKVA